MENIRTNNTGEGGALGLLFGKGYLAQTLLAFVILVVVFLLLTTLEFFYLTFSKLSNRRIELLPYTASSEDKQVVIKQDTLKYPEGKQIPFSENERTGIEFTYSFFLYVNPSTFTQRDMLYHVFHKGFTVPWPLMGPAVFIKGDTNTMRVVMNTYKNPYCALDIENIPVRKWFHVALVCRKNALEVYINGNLRKKLPFEESLPYQNFQDIILFSQVRTVVRGSTTPALGGQNFEVDGVFKGNLSSLIYLNYAASFSEIAGMVNVGPSKKVLSQTADKPPYLIDTWWTTPYAQ